MTSNPNDWRETDRRLSELPDEKLRTALEAAGVRAVLPSHKKRHNRFRERHNTHDVTASWAKGDWHDGRVSLDDLPDALKFLEDPSKPPTAVIRTSLQVKPRSSMVRGMGWGLSMTAVAAVVAVVSLEGFSWLDRPRITARALPAAAPSVPVEPAPAPKEPLAQHVQPEADAERPQRVTYLTRLARAGDHHAMVVLAREAVERTDAETALKWASAAKKADRDSIESRILLGDALILSGQPRKAMRVWRGAQARSPRNKELRKRLAVYGAR